MKLAKVFGLQILDSRGNPTLGVTMSAEDGTQASFGVPAGVSRGSHEAIELRDDGPVYGGLSVGRAIAKINQLAAELVGYELGDQAGFDAKLSSFDPSERFSQLGGNTALGLSGAYLKLSAEVQKLPLWQYVSAHTASQPAWPRLFANLVNGGKHAPGVAVQEFMIVPQATLPSQAIEMIWKVRQNLSKIIIGWLGSVAALVGDEGGIAPIGGNSEEVLNSLFALRHEQNESFDIALDVAASSFFNDGQYEFEKAKFSSSQLQDLLQNWAKHYQLLSIEDPLEENDLVGFTKLTGILTKTKVIGDDISFTNAIRIIELAKVSAIEGVIIKPNQAGTFSKTFAAVAAARAAKLAVIVSHRSGETNDSLITDLAYGLGADGIKLGAPVRGERVAKYNRLSEIEYAIIKPNGA